MSRGYGPKTNKHPTCTTLPADWSRRKLEQEHAKLKGRRKCSDPPECLKPPPPYSARDFHPDNFPVVYESNTSFCVRECPRCSHTLPTADCKDNAESMTPIIIQEVREVLLIRKSQSESCGLDVKVNKERFYISKVMMNSPAYNAGIKVGDEVFSVNGCSRFQITKDDLREFLCADAVRMLLRPRHVIVINKMIRLYKTDKLGLQLLSRNDAIYIAKVMKSSPAAAGDLLAGDEIVKVDNKDVQDLTEEKVTTLLKEFPNYSYLELVIRRTYPTRRERRDKATVSNKAYDKRQCLGREYYDSDGRFFALTNE